MNLLAYLVSATLALAANPFDHLAEELSHNPELVDVSAWDGVQLDVRYATTNNFTHQNVYGPYHSCFLHQVAATQLRRALDALHAKKPQWKLRVFDCLRPVRAQAKLFAVVEGTPNEKYVVNPVYGSLHSYGFAIDVSLSDETGKEVDMGTRFDFFGAQAEPQHEAELLRSGQLTPLQVQNRELLRSFLRAGGFRTITTEWWHFDALDGATVRSQYEQIP